MADFGRVKDRGSGAAVKSQHQRKYRAQLAYGENGHERKRVHAAHVSLAVWNIHRAPKQAGSGRGQDAAHRVLGVRPTALDGAEAQHDGCAHDGQRAEDHLGDVLPAGAFQFAEQDPAPENADQ